MTKNYNKDKGLFLQEFYSVKEIPALQTKEGIPTKFAEAAKYWGEEAPTNETEVKQLVALGATLLVKENLSISEKINDSSWYAGKQQLSVLDKNMIKVPFVKQGSWDHEVYGKVEFTQKDVQELITNYKNNVTGFTPYLTLGHLDEEINSTDSHRKRGDLHDIIEEGDTTYGIFKVNDAIYESVLSGEFEYSSGEFHRNFKDRGTGDQVGTTVLRVALTNSPFLPFGDKKIQALSNEGENCPESKENYVFLLSLDTSNSEVKSNDEVHESAEQPVEVLSNEVSIPEESKPETKNTPIDNLTMQTNNQVAKETSLETNITPEVINEPAAPLQLETTEVAVVKETMPNPNDQLVANLAAQLQKVQDLYATQLDAANATIADLGNKVSVLSDKLIGQQEVTQAFSNSMGLAQERALIQNLQNNGVLPNNIQRFISLKNAFQATEDKNVVKFSVGVGEDAKVTEQNVLDAIAELLIAASNQTPLVEQQLGVSAGRKTGAFDFSSIIEKNQAAATKFQK